MTAGLEAEVARRGIKVTAAGLRATAYVIFLVLLVFLTWQHLASMAKLRQDVEDLETFKTSVEQREALNATAAAAAAAAEAARDEADRQAEADSARHEQATQEARNEDPAARDFLDSRIPDRLLRADREARSRPAADGGADG